uniref:Uncharacterized protein n=1 Tax=viral metagenome TaxID=1070528 RepID=A0A6C0II78_9ZZZZ
MLLISKEIFLSLAFITFFYYYNYPNELNILLLNVQTYIDKCVNKYEDIFEYLLIGDGCSIEGDTESETDFDEISEENNELETTFLKEVKYEDKYLVDIRKLNKEFIFDDEEKELEEKKKDEILTTLNNNYKETVNIVNVRLKEIETELKNTDTAEYRIDILRNTIGRGYPNTGEDAEIINEFLKKRMEKFEEDLKNTVIDEEIINTSIDNRRRELLEEYNTLVDEINHLYNVNEEEQVKEFKEKAEFEAKKMIIDNKLNRLKDCFVMEKTPLGNVLMFYNHSRDAFEFFSDNTIPYRYLETVARKYVKIFNCRPIFVDMEEELRICEERIEKEEKEKEEQEKEKEALKLLNNTNQQVKQVEQKKSVFAKFKSYNKEAGTGRVNTCAPPKNSIPNKPVTEKDSTEKILMKENANRYTYEGKLSNFNFLKKVERKMVDKKYGMSFAEFKRQLICGNN